MTNPVTRHPAVVAGAFGTLAEQSEGRAILGIGVGESAVRTIGEAPATLRELEDYVGVVRGLLDDGQAAYRDEMLRLSWPAPSTPVFIASSGPRSLRLAGRIADGVLFQVGSSPALVQYALDAISEGAHEGARRQQPRCLVRLACVVSEDREEARREARGYVAAAAGTVYGAVPRAHIEDDLHADLQRMKERYDYSRHAASDAEHAQLITDRIIDAIAIAGTPDEAVPRLRELIDLGVDGFVIPITASDPMRAMRVLAERVLPEL